MINREWAETATRAIMDYVLSSHTRAQFERDVDKMEVLFAKHEEQIRDEQLGFGIWV